MRIYISADIEGIAGVVSRENLSPGGFEYEKARDWMTAAVLAACETCKELGAEEVVVSDSHGNGMNLRFEKMPDYVSLVRSWPRPLGMMQGVEIGRYDGALLIGYHAGASNPAGTLSHTVHGGFFREVRLNGKPVSEAAISATIAAQFGVPILMVAGDDIAIEECRAFLGEIATVCLKTSTGWMSALMPSPPAADLNLRAGVRDAIGRIGKVQPYLLEAPFSLEIDLRSRLMAEWLGYLQEVERLGADTIRVRADTIVEISKFLGFLGSARTALG